MTRDGTSGRQRRRAERDRAFTEPVHRPAATQDLAAAAPGSGPGRAGHPQRPAGSRRTPSGAAPYDTGDRRGSGDTEGFAGRPEHSAPRTPDTGGPRPADVHGNGHHNARAAGRGMVRGAGAMARFTATAGRRTVYAARRASEAQGAGESGLARLIQVHAFSSAGDAAVTIGLAGTVFFSVSSAQAKGQVLLFLCLTMLPFAIVAPLVGPLLDRFRHGRRWAIGFTLALRAFLCWVLAQTVDDHSVWLFPVALCVLVASKAYLVTRSAAAPRLLPSGLTLVKANGRLSLAGVVGAGVAGAIAGTAAKLGGGAWALRVAALLFAVGTVLAILLPPRVDSSIGEKPAPTGLASGRAGGIGPAVITALRANVGLRWLSGFLTIFLAFLVRSHPFPGWAGRETLLLALVLGAAGVGNSVGTVAGAALRIAAPRTIVLATLIADAGMVVIAAAHFTVVTATAVGFVAGVGQQLGKLALDSQIQDTVPEHMRTSVFGRSETLLQLAWVIGGIVAVAIPTDASLGMVVSAVVLVAWASAVLIWHSGRSLPVPARVRGGRRGRATAGGNRRADVPGDAGAVSEPGPPAHPVTQAMPCERPQPDPAHWQDERTIGVRRSAVAGHRPDPDDPEGRPRPRPGGWR